jgi:rhodanese-related sulfurtransferase
MKRMWVMGAAVMALGVWGGCAQPTPTEEAAQAAPQARCEGAGEVVFERSPGGVPEVSAAWLEANRCRVRLVDVREADELVEAPGHLAGVTWAPLEVLEEAAHGWRTDEPIVLVCRSGRRSAQAIKRLEQLGFGSVASLSGGMLMWEASGRPVSVRADDVVPAVPQGFKAKLAHKAAHEAEETSVAQMFGQPGAVRWVKVAALVMEGAESCVDGRNPEAVLGTPGGDAGEFLLALAAVEQVSGQQLSEAQVGALLDRYVEAFGRFYMHTDTYALKALGEALTRDGRLSAWRAQIEEDVGAFVRHPPRGAEQAVLEAISAAEHVGCGHIKLQLKHPEEYGVRAELVQSFLRVFFAHMWSAPGELTWDILDGKHAEQAVVQIRVDEPVYAFTRVPALAPEHHGAQVFVVHPQVATYMRGLHVEFFIPALRAQGVEVERAAFEQALNALAARQQDATLGHLASGLPRHEVIYAPYSAQGWRVPQIKQIK